jgi:PIN domain nuclease of toxin-antitoxin system
LINLDTHVVVHLLAGTLTDREREVVRREAGGVSCIVLWELAKLVQLGRLRLDLHGEPFQAFLRGVTVWPIDLAVAEASTRLDVHSDPADELIAATSVVHGAPLLTRDRRLLASRVVPLA